MTEQLTHVYFMACPHWTQGSDLVKVGWFEALICGWALLVLPAGDSIPILLVSFWWGRPTTFPHLLAMVTGSVMGM